MPAQDGETTVRVFNVNTRSRIDVTVLTPGRRVTYDGETGIDGVAGTAAPIRLDFLDAWGAVTGSLFPTGRRIDTIEGVQVTCIDAAMPLVIVRAARPRPERTRDARRARRRSLAARAHRSPAPRRRCRRWAWATYPTSVIPKPVIASDGDDANSVTSRYFTPRRCHASHAVTGAIGVATAFALPGTVISGASGPKQACASSRCCIPQGRIEVEVDGRRPGADARVQRAALVRTARKILQGELHIPPYVFSKPIEGDKP